MLNVRLFPRIFGAGRRHLKVKSDRLLTSFEILLFLTSKGYLNSNKSHKTIILSKQFYPRSCYLTFLWLQAIPYTWYFVVTLFPKAVLSMRFLSIKNIGKNTEKTVEVALDINADITTTPSISGSGSSAMPSFLQSFFKLHGARLKFIAAYTDERKWRRAKRLRKKMLIA